MRRSKEPPVCRKRDRAGVVLAGTAGSQQRVSRRTGTPKAGRREPDVRRCWARWQPCGFPSSLRIPQPCRSASFKIGHGVHFTRTPDAEDIDGLCVDQLATTAEKVPYTSPTTTAHRFCFSVAYGSRQATAFGLVIMEPQLEKARKPNQQNWPLCDAGTGMRNSALRPERIEAEHRRPPPRY